MDSDLRMICTAGAAVVGASGLAYCVLSERESEQSAALRRGATDDLLRAISSTVNVHQQVTELPRASSFFVLLQQAQAQGQCATPEQLDLLDAAVAAELSDALERTRQHRDGESGHAGYADGVRLRRALELADAVGRAQELGRRRCFWLCNALAWRPWRRRTYYCKDREMGLEAKKLLDLILAERQLLGATGRGRVMRLWCRAAPVWAIGCMASTAQAGITPKMFACLTEIVDVSTQVRESGSDRETGYRAIREAAITAAGIFVLTRALSIIGDSLTEKAIATFQIRISDEVLRAVARQDTDFFDRQPYQALLARIRSSVGGVSGSLFETPQSLIGSAVQLTMCTRAVSADAPKLFLPCVVPIPFAMAIGLWIMVLSSDESFDYAGDHEDMLFREIRTVRAHAQEQVEVNRLHTLRDEQRRKDSRSGLCSQLAWKSGEGLLASGALGMYYLGAQLVLEGKLAAGKLQGLQFIATSLLPSVMQFFYSLYQATGCWQAVRDVANLMDMPSTIEPGGPHVDAETVGPQLGCDSITGTITFDNVGFAYPTSSGKGGALKGLSFTVEPGQHIAVVGRRGCGKTTVCRLLQRFYDPDVGQILLDGRKLQDYDVHKLRRCIGVVAQDSVLIGHTIRDAVAYGLNPKPTDAEIEGACREANAWEFIAGGGEFKDQLNTRIGPGGVELSGGQRQCVCIARALIRKPSILLLDEATSNLDAVSEKRVQQGLDALRSKDWIKSSITIAHRLHTIMGAHQIVCLANGQVVEQGTHSELVHIPVEHASPEASQSSDIGGGTQGIREAVRGIYHHMWDMQTRVSGDDSRAFQMEERLQQLESENRRLKAELHAVQHSSGGSKGGLSSFLR